MQAAWVELADTLSHTVPNLLWSRAWRGFSQVCEAQRTSPTARGSRRCVFRALDLREVQLFARRGLIG